MDEKTGKGLIAKVKDRVAGVRDRASWALAGGKIAHEGVQEKTRAQIASIVQATIDDPESVRALGLRLPGAAPTADADGVDLDAKDLGSLVCELASRGAVALATRAGFHAEVVPLAALDGDERKALIPSIAKVINKYLPKDLGRWAEEIELATKLLAIAIAKFHALRAAQASKVPIQKAA